jgi:hypothetical protein
MRRAVVRFEPHHVWQVESRSAQSRAEIVQAMKLIHNRPGLFFSLAVDDRLIGLAGIVVLVPGVGFPMGLFSDAVAAHKIWFHRTVKQYFNAIVRHFDLKKLGVVGAADSERDCRWIESLGFELKGPVPDYRDSRGRSYLLFLREVN